MIKETLPPSSIAESSRVHLSHVPHTDDTDSDAVHGHHLLVASGKSVGSAIQSFI